MGDFEPFASGEAFLMFGERMALFDLVGPRVIWRFVEHSRAAARGVLSGAPGKPPVVRRRRPAHHQDGEEARVALRHFHLHHQRPRICAMRSSTAERDGMSFELIGDSAERREMMGWLDVRRLARGARRARKAFLRRRVRSLWGGRERRAPDRLRRRHDQVEERRPPHADAPDARRLALCDGISVLAHSAWRSRAVSEPRRWRRGSAPRVVAGRLAMEPRRQSDLAARAKSL